MSARYRPQGDWTCIDTREVDSGDVEPAGYVTIEVADAVDTRNGDVWHHGCHRVKTRTRFTIKGRGRTFIGETAWMDAERLAGDLVNEIRQAAWGR